MGKVIKKMAQKKVEQGLQNVGNNFLRNISKPIY